nr:hypothetical protein [Tanacetum cinerariifolium]
MFNNMCFFPYGLLVPKILRTLMLILLLKLRSLSLKFMFLQAIVPRQRNMMIRLQERLKERVMSSYQHELEICMKNLKIFLLTALTSTNTFSAVGPSNTVVCLTLGKSSYVDPSQYLDDLNMPALEDITNPDDEEDVGAEADFSNLETNITEELLQFKMQKVWVLVDLPKGKRAIGFKWVFRNKKDERDIVMRNKARLVTQGHTQEDGMDYEELFATVSRIEAIKAWYETLANYLLENGFQREFIDQTLFIKKQKSDILLVQVYVDDIISGSTNKDLCKAFKKLMKDKF